MKTSTFEEAQKLRNNGQIPESISVYEKIRTQALTKNDVKTAAECLHMIGVAYYQIEKFEKAEETLNKAQIEYELQKNDEFVAFVLRDRGMVARIQRNFDAADVFLQKSITLLHKVGNHGHEGITLVKLGRVFADRGEFSDAVRLINQGISLLENSSDVFFCSTAHLDYAKVLLQRGDNEFAQKEAKKSLEILNSFAKQNEFLERRREISRILDESYEHSK